MDVKINKIISHVKNNYIFIIIVFILIVIIIVTSFFEIRFVKGDSMTRQDYCGEKPKYEIVFSKRLRNKKKSFNISKGDIVIYKIPFTKEKAMKKVIACPSDVIYINKNNIFVNNKNICNKYDWRFGIFSLKAMGNTNISSITPWIKLKRRNLTPISEGLKIRYTACLYNIMLFLNKHTNVPYDELCNVNGRPLSTYKTNTNLYTMFVDNMSLKIFDNYYFLLAENPRGYDCRFHGLVHEESIISQVLFHFKLF